MVERVDTFKYLGVTIEKDLTWDCHATSVVKKAQQCLCGLGCLKKFGLRPNTIRDFYRGTIESLLTSMFCILVWQLYGQRPQGAEDGCPHCSIIEDPTHPHKLK